MGFDEAPIDETVAPQHMKEGVSQRRISPRVRLEMESAAPPWLHE
jgi:hypothetical protein